MDAGGYRIRNQKEIHFISFAAVEWVDVFTRKDYRDVLLDSLRFCQNSKQLRLHGWRQDNQPKECYSPAFTIQKFTPLLVFL